MFLKELSSTRPLFCIFFLVVSPRSGYAMVTMTVVVVIEMSTILEAALHLQVYPAQRDSLCPVLDHTEVLCISIVSNLNEPSEYFDLSGHSFLCRK